MRTEFHQQLDALNADLARMCGLAGEAMQRATEGLLTVDLEAAERVLSDLEILSRLRRDVDQAALAVLARRHLSPATCAWWWRPCTSRPTPTGWVDSQRMWRESSAVGTRLPPFRTLLSVSSPRWAVSLSISLRMPPWSSRTETPCGRAGFATTTRR